MPKKELKHSLRCMIGLHKLGHSQYHRSEELGILHFVRYCIRCPKPLESWMKFDGGSRWLRYDPVIIERRKQQIIEAKALGYLLFKNFVSNNSEYNVTTNETLH